MRSLETIYQTLYAHYGDLHWWPADNLCPHRGKCQGALPQKANLCRLSFGEHVREKIASRGREKIMI